MTRNAAVILNFNDSKRSLMLAKTLVSYGCFFSVTIVDNCSKREERSLLSQAPDGVKVLFGEKNLGYGAGNNIGLRDLEKDAPSFVFLMNPDIVPTRKAVLDCIAFMEGHPEIAACSTKMTERGKPVRNYYDIPSYRSTLLGDNYFSRTIRSQERHDGYFTCGFVRESFALYRYGLMRDVGFFDEDFFMFDEGASLWFRFLEKGYKEAIVENGEYVEHAHIGPKINRKGFATLKRSRAHFLRDYLGTPEWKIAFFRFWWVNIFPY